MNWFYYVQFSFAYLILIQFFFIICVIEESFQWASSDASFPVKMASMWGSSLPRKKEIPQLRRCVSKRPIWVSIVKALIFVDAYFSTILCFENIPQLCEEYYIENNDNCVCNVLQMDYDYELLPSSGSGPLSVQPTSYSQSSSGEEYQPSQPSLPSSLGSQPQQSVISCTRTCCNVS